VDGLKREEIYHFVIVMSASAVNQVIKAQRIAWLPHLLATATVRSTHNTWHLENLKSEIGQDKKKSHNKRKVNNL
jgi:hypothetical protein